MPAKIDFAGVVLTKGIKIGEFRAHWAKQFAQASPPAEIQAQEDVGAELEQSSTSETHPRAGTFGHRHFAPGGAVHHFHHAQYGRGRAHPPVRHAARGCAHESASRRHDRSGKSVPGADRLGRRPAGRLGIVGDRGPPAAGPLPDGSVAGILVHRALGHLRAGRIAGGFRPSRMEGHARQSAGGHGRAPACAVGALLLGRHRGRPAPDLRQPARRVLHSHAGHGALCRLGDLGLPRDGHWIRAAWRR